MRVDLLRRSAFRRLISGVSMMGVSRKRFIAITATSFISAACTPNAGQPNVVRRAPRGRFRTTPSTALRDDLMRIVPRDSVLPRTSTVANRDSVMAPKLESQAIPWDFFSDGMANGSERVIRTIRYVVTSDQHFDTNLTIYADELVLDHSISAPDKNISIFARKITVANASKIDVSGGPGMSWDPSDPAQSGRKQMLPASENGMNGAKGGDAGNGGSITVWVDEVVGKLVCLANGGLGGRGRGGGDGETGLDGANGTQRDCAPGTAGGNGGTGGNAGAAGGGGDGGDPGAIFVNVTSELASYELSARGGRGGDPGTDGKPGNGGAKGIGAQSFHFEGDRCNRRCVSIGKAEDGKPGLSGGIPPTKAVRGRDKGDATASPRRRSDAEFGAAWDVEHLTMISHKIDLWYLSERYNDAATRALWMERILRANGKSSSTHDRKQALYSHVDAIVRQLKSSLDFYGFPWSYVPLTTLPTYDRLLSNSLESGKLIETSYTGYASATSDAEARRAATNDALATVDDTIKGLNDQMAAVIAEREGVRSQIDELRNELTLMAAEIVEKHAQFVRDVQKQLDQSCDFQGALIALSTILVATGVFGEAGGAIAVAVDVLEPGSSHTATDRFTSIKKIGGSIKDITNAVVDLRKELGRKPRTFEDLDFAKLVLKQKQYDDLLDQFKSLTSSVELKDLVDRYFIVNQARNERIVYYSASFATEDRIRSQVSSLESQRGQLQSALVGNEIQYTLTTEAKTFVGTLYEEAKAEALRLIWFKRKALEYETLMELPQAALEFVDFSILANINAHLDTSASKARDEGSKGDYRLREFDLPIEVLLVESESSFNKLDANYRSLPFITLGNAFVSFTSRAGAANQAGTLPFVIKPNSPVFDYGFTSIRLDGIDARLIGVASTPTYSSTRFALTLEHRGFSIILDPLNHKHAYLHRRVNASVLYDLGDPFKLSLNNISGQLNDSYVGISPFAAWKLTVTPHNGVLPDLRNVVAVRLRFYGRYQSIDAESNPIGAAQLLAQSRFLPASRPEGGEHNSQCP